LGDQQCIGPFNFFAVVCKKQEISQQVFSKYYFIIFILLFFFGSNNQGRNHGRKVEILEPI